MRWRASRITRSKLQQGRDFSNQTSVTVNIRQTGSKAIAPAFGQNLDVERSSKGLAVGGFRGIKPVYFGDGEGGLFTSEEFKLVARADFSFFDDREIETATTAEHEALDDVVSLKPGCKFEAGKPWRRHHDLGGANAVAV